MNVTATEPTVLIDVADGVAVVTLNRPTRRNALDMAMRVELRAALETVRADPEVRAVVLTGAGGAFCAGGDISGMKHREPGAEAGRKRMRDVGELALAMVTLDKPLIAAVDGPAFGAGFGMALAADFILATPQARFCASFARIGLAPDFLMHWTLPRWVGPSMAKELVFTARELDAEEAKSLKLVHEIVPSEDLAAFARDFAGRFRAASPTAMALAKALFQQSPMLDPRQAAEAETAHQVLCFETEAHQSAVSRFLNREPAAFVWPKG